MRSLEQITDAELAVTLERVLRQHDSPYGLFVSDPNHRGAVTVDGDVDPLKMAEELREELGKL